MIAELVVPGPYPVRLDVDYPERQSRWQALLRLPLAIPVLLFSSLLRSYVVLAIWAAVLGPWFAGRQGMSAADHQRGMYRALTAWAVTDIVLAVAFAT